VIAVSGIKDVAGDPSEFVNVIVWPATGVVPFNTSKTIG